MIKLLDADIADGADKCRLKSAKIRDIRVISVPSKSFPMIKHKKADDIGYENELQS